MTLEPNLHSDNSKRNIPKFSDPRVLIGLELDVSHFKPHSPEYLQVLIAAVNQIKIVSGALFPSSTADALYEYGLSNDRHKNQNKPGGFVYPRLTDAGTLFSSELVNATPETAPYLLLAIRELKRLKSVSLPVVKLLCEWHQVCKGWRVDQREFRKLVLSFRAMDCRPSRETLRTFFVHRKYELLSENYSRQWLGGASPEQRLQAIEWLRDSGNAADTPVAPEHTDRKNALQKTACSIFRRANLYSGTFWRYSGDAMSIITAPTSSRMKQSNRAPHSLLSQFAEENFREACNLHSSDPNSSPGRGIFMYQPRLHNLFFGINQAGEMTASAEQRYDKVFNGMPGVLEDFKHAAFAFLRGGILVQVLGSRFTAKIGKLSKPVHYSLFIPNDHLWGAYEHAYLIPSSRLNLAIITAKYSFGATPNEGTGDLADSIFGRDRLLRLKEAPFAIGLTNISALFGGLVAGIPLNAFPLFSWEENSKIHSGWRDVRGRAHYRWQLKEMKLQKDAERYREPDRQQLRDQFLAPYERASSEIGSVATRLLNVLDLFFHRYAAWKSDLVPRQSPTPRLVSAFYGHHLRSQKEGDPQSAPKLCIYHRTNLAEPPIMIGDPGTLTLNLDGERGLLPPAGADWDTQEFAMWRKAVSVHAHRYLNSDGARGRFETDYEIGFIKQEYIG